METVKAGQLAGAVHECGCGPCRRGEAHPSREYHRQMNLLLSRLDEQQRRWYLAVESERMGWGADRQLMEITGVDEKTIRRVGWSWPIRSRTGQLTGYVCRVGADPRKKRPEPAGYGPRAHRARDRG